jgi:hypothetical protein
VNHFHRAYGRSQFFNVPRVARTLTDLVNLWFELVVHKKHLRGPAPAIARGGVGGPESPPTSLEPRRIHSDVAPKGVKD